MTYFCKPQESSFLRAIFSFFMSILIPLSVSRNWEPTLFGMCKVTQLAHWIVWHIYMKNVLSIAWPTKSPTIGKPSHVCLQYTMKDGSSLLCLFLHVSAYASASDAWWRRAPTKQPWRIQRRSTAPPGILSSFASCRWSPRNLVGS